MHRQCRLCNIFVGIVSSPSLYFVASKLMHVVYIYMYTYNVAPIYIYSKTSLSQLTMGSNLCGPFREVVGLGS